MQIGINQDIVFKGERFHIQTEDSGVKRPVITTILFKGGVIIASRKTGYEDKLGTKDLEKVVNELMQTQHKDIIRALKHGDFKKGKKGKGAGKDLASVEVSAKPADAAGKATQASGKRPLKVSKKALEKKVLECLSLK